MRKGRLGDLVNDEGACGARSASPLRKAGFVSPIRGYLTANWMII